MRNGEWGMGNEELGVENCKFEGVEYLKYFL